MFRRKDHEQSSFWIATSDLPLTPANTFYRRLDRALAKSGFGDAVRELCAPFYESDRHRGGRPGIDPEVYFKMQLVGFFRESGERAHYRSAVFGFAVDSGFSALQPGSNDAGPFPS